MKDDWTFYALASWVSGLQEAGRRAERPVYGWTGPLPEDFLNQAPYPVNAFLQYLQGSVLVQALKAFRALCIASLKVPLFVEELEEELEEELVRGLPTVFLASRGPYEHVAAPLWGGPLGKRIRIGVRWLPSPPGSLPELLFPSPPISGYLQIFLRPYREGGQEGFPFSVWIRTAGRRNQGELWPLVVETIVLGHFLLLHEMAMDYSLRDDPIVEGMLLAVFGEEDEPTGDLPPLYHKVPVGYGVEASAWDLFRETRQRLERSLNLASRLARHQMVAPTALRLAQFARAIIPLLEQTLQGDPRAKERLNAWLRKL